MGVFSGLLPTGEWPKPYFCKGLYKYSKNVLPRNRGKNAGYFEGAWIMLEGALNMVIFWFCAEGSKLSVNPTSILTLQGVYFFISFAQDDTQKGAFTQPTVNIFHALSEKKDLFSSEYFPPSVNTPLPFFCSLWQECIIDKASTLFCSHLNTAFLIWGTVSQQFSNSTRMTSPHKHIHRSTCLPIFRISFLAFSLIDTVAMLINSSCISTTIKPWCGQ